eukprot:g70785.t1
MATRSFFYNALIWWSLRVFAEPLSAGEGKEYYVSDSTTPSVEGQSDASDIQVEAQVGVGVGTEREMEQLLRSLKAQGKLSSLLEKLEDDQTDPTGNSKGNQEASGQAQTEVSAAQEDEGSDVVQHGDEEDEEDMEEGMEEDEQRLRVVWAQMEPSGEGISLLDVCMTHITIARKRKHKNLHLGSLTLAIGVSASSDSLRFWSLLPADRIPPHSRAKAKHWTPTEATARQLPLETPNPRLALCELGGQSEKGAAETPEAETCEDEVRITRVATLHINKKTTLLTGHRDGALCVSTLEAWAEPAPEGADASQPSMNVSLSLPACFHPDTVPNPDLTSDSQQEQQSPEEQASLEGEQTSEGDTAVVWAGAFSKKKAAVYMAVHKLGRVWAINHRGRSLMDYHHNFSVQAFTVSEEERPVLSDVEGLTFLKMPKGRLMSEAKAMDVRCNYSNLTSAHITSLAYAVDSPGMLLAGTASGEMLAIHTKHRQRLCKARWILSVTRKPQPIQVTSIQGYVLAVTPSGRFHVFNVTGRKMRSPERVRDATMSLPTLMPEALQPLHFKLGAVVVDSVKPKQQFVSALWQIGDAQQAAQPSNLCLLHSTLFFKQPEGAWHLPRIPVLLIAVGAMGLYQYLAKRKAAPKSTSPINNMIDMMKGLDPNDPDFMEKLRAMESIQFANARGREGPLRGAGRLPGRRAGLLASRGPHAGGGRASSGPRVGGDPLGNMEGMLMSDRNAAAFLGARSMDFDLD